MLHTSRDRPQPRRHRSSSRNRSVVARPAAPASPPHSLRRPHCSHHYVLALRAPRPRPTGPPPACADQLAELGHSRSCGRRQRARGARAHTPHPHHPTLPRPAPASLCTVLCHCRALPLRLWRGPRIYGWVTRTLCSRGGRVARGRGGAGRAAPCTRSVRCSVHTAAYGHAAAARRGS